MSGGSADAGSVFVEAKVRIFLYGSLLPGMENHEVIKPYLLSEARSGVLSGRLVDAGPYPAIVLGAKGKHEGQFVRGVWVEVRRAALQALDALEEFHGSEEKNDYDRVWVKDAHDLELAGWTYVWPDSRGYPAAEGDWWPELLARRRAAESVAWRDPSSQS